MKGLILISTVAFSLASFAASASEAPSESVCSLTHLKLVADKEGLDPAGALAKECIGKGYTAAKAFFAEGYDAGHGQPSFDKQFVRNWLKANPDSNYDLPQDVIDKTIEKYLEAYEMLTGKKL